MKCYVEFGLRADIIELPKAIARKVDRYRSLFLDWIYDPNSTHEYWIEVRDDSNGWYKAACYDTEAFVKWLNENVVSSQMKPVAIVEHDVGINNCPEGMLRIFF